MSRIILINGFAEELLIQDHDGIRADYQVAGVAPGYGLRFFARQPPARLSEAFVLVHLFDMFRGDNLEWDIQPCQEILTTG